MSKLVLLICVFLSSSLLFAEDLTFLNRSDEAIEGIILYDNYQLLKLNSQDGPVINAGTRVKVVSTHVIQDNLYLKILHDGSEYYGLAKRVMYNSVKIDSVYIGLIAMKNNGDFVDMVLYYKQGTVKAYQLKPKNILLPVIALGYEDITGDGVPEILARSAAFDGLSYDYWFQINAEGLSTLVAVPSSVEDFSVIDYSFIPSKSGNPIRLVLKKNNTQYIGSLIRHNNQYHFEDMIFPCQGQITTSRLNFRQSPGVDGEKIGTLVKDQKVTIIGSTFTEVTVSGETGTWYQVKTEENQIGWVFSPYIRWQRP